MTDAANPLDPADAEALSAYLCGEMAPDDVAAFEARLDAEPALAAAADALADALTSLSGADSVDVPDGFETRLAQRLDDERRSAAADRAPADLAAHRQRREGRSRMWLGIGTAAAVLAAGAVMSGTVLRGMDGQGATSDVAMEGTAGDEAGQAMDSGAEMSTEEAFASAPADGPVILDDQVAVADEDALRRRYASLPEAGGVLGLSTAQARPVAERYAAAVDGRDLSIARLEASSDSAGADGGATAGDGDEPTAGGSESAPVQDSARQRSGAPGDPCLATITADARAPLVPVRVETLRYDGAEAIAYVLVTASPGAERLDRTEVWVVAPDCSTLVFQQY